VITVSEFFSLPLHQKLHIIILLALEVKFFGSKDPFVYFIATFPEGVRNKIYGTNNSLNYKTKLEYRSIGYLKAYPSL
jgi:hypothetical protein